MRRILITGATGFTGRHTVPKLLERFGEVTCFVRPTSDRTPVALPGVHFAEGTLDDPSSLAAALEGHDTLVNIASLGFGHGAGIVEACHRARVSRAVFVSTTSLFTALNADSKAVRLAAEEVIRESGLAYTILRPTMIYGTPGDRNMIRLIRFLSLSPVMPVLGSGEHLQQPIHVEDLAQALTDCLDATATVGRAYNLSGARSLTFNAVVDETSAALGVRRHKIHVPLEWSLWAARMSQRVFRLAVIKEEQIRRLNEDKAFDHTDATRDFGFAPRDFSEGIRQEVMFLQKP